jgi:3-methyl-2-oxobutanoate hydroxymethyltransferase
MTTRKSVLDLQKMKAGSQKIAMITAYDYTMARLVDSAGVDAVLVGDSVGMVIQGRPDTLSVTLEDMIYHSKCVNRGLDSAHLIVDMPFMTYQSSPIQALDNAGRLVKEGHAQSVKMEGGERIAPMIKMVVDAGIPVIAHLGLTPQSVNTLGGYRVQGRSVEEREKLKQDALAVQDAGASLLVLEMVPAPLAKQLTSLLTIPTIGIGAGVHCDGQILVCNDLLGMDLTFQPRFVKRYSQLETSIQSSVSEYVHEVREGGFPTDDNSFGVRSSKIARLY